MIDTLKGNLKNKNKRKIKVLKINSYEKTKNQGGLKTNI